MTRPVSVEELKRGWAAVQAGRFRPGHPGDPGDREQATVPVRTPCDATASGSWTPPEAVVSVVGCIGSAGASTLALATALAAGNAESDPAQAASAARGRVVECASMTASGLAAAPTAELGLDTESGWRSGTRHEHFGGRTREVFIERSCRAWTRPEQVPPPATAHATVTLSVIDVGWEIGQVVLGPDSWLRTHLRTTPSLVLVTRATVPGIARLETALQLLADARPTPPAAPAAPPAGPPAGPPPRVVAAVLGPRRRRWPRGVEHAGGPHTRTLWQASCLVEVPIDPALAVSGIGAAPLPVAVLACGAAVLRLLTPRPAFPHEPPPDQLSKEGPSCSLRTRPI
jgi:hypothetical protein